MVELNSTMMIQMINFFILIFLLNTLLYKPILSIIEKRKNMMAESDNEARSLHETVDRKMAEYEEKLYEARMEAANQRDQIKGEGSEKGRQIIEGAKEEISKMVEGFKQKLEKEREEARSVLQDRTKGIAFEISEKILGRGIQ